MRGDGLRLFLLLLTGADALVLLCNGTVACCMGTLCVDCDCNECLLRGGTPLGSGTLCDTHRCSCCDLFRSSASSTFSTGVSSSGGTVSPSSTSSGGTTTFSLSTSGSGGTITFPPSSTGGTSSFSSGGTTSSGSPPTGGTTTSSVNPPPTTSSSSSGSNTQTGGSSSCPPPVGFPPSSPPPPHHPPPPPPLCNETTFCRTIYDFCCESEQCRRKWIEPLESRFEFCNALETMVCNLPLNVSDICHCNSTLELVYWMFVTGNPSGPPACSAGSALKILFSLLLLAGTQ